jgi:hypothetical protein
MNITELIDEFGDKHIMIDRGNGEFTSMPKSVYEAMQAQQSTPNLAD